jgi:predicted butyrate kinase (DUF1464 family)
VADWPNRTLPRLQAELVTRSGRLISKVQLSKAKTGAEGAAPAMACTGGRTRRRALLGTLDHGSGELIAHVSAGKRRAGHVGANRRFRLGA